MKNNFFTSQKSKKSESRIIKNILQDKTQHFFSNMSVKWKYNRIKNTAWVTHDSFETLQKIADFLKASINPENLELNRTQEEKKPILVIRILNEKNLENLLQNRPNP